MSPAIGEPRHKHRVWLADDGTSTGETAGVRPQQILQVIRHRGWIVVVVTALCLAGALLVRAAGKPLYVSTAQIIIDPREPQGIAGGAAPRNDNADTTEAMVGNEMRVLKSNSLLMALIDEDDLIHDPEFLPKPSTVTELRGLIDATLGHSREAVETRDAKLAVLQRLDQAIAVQRTERSFVMDVTVRTTDAEKSAKLANDLVTLYIAQTAATTTDLNRRVSTALQDRLSELQARVQAADTRVEQFRIANHLVSAGGVLTSDQRLRLLTDQLSLAQVRENEDRSKADALNALPNMQALGGVPEAVQAPAVAQLRGQLADAVRRRAALAMQLGPRHPDLVAADQQVATAQHLLDQELQRVAQATRTQYGRSKTNAEALRKGFDTLAETSLNNSSALAQLRELEQEAEAARVLFTSFLSRSRELSEQTQIYTSNVRQIGTALPALSSTGLPASLIYGLVTLLGLVIGTLLAFGSEAADRWRGRPVLRTESRIG